MEYYLITKTNVTWKWKPIKFKGGLSFNQKMPITLYNFGMIRYILIKKMNKSLKGIITLYLMYEDNDDESSDTAIQELIPKVEFLRKVFIEKYALYMSESEIESYLMKLDKLEAKIQNRGMKKTRSM